MELYQYTEFTRHDIILLLEGLGWTLLVFSVSMACGVLIGLVCALVRHARVRGLGMVVMVYVEVFRNSPVLVQLVLIFYGLPVVAQMRLSPLTAAVLTMSINTGVKILTQRDAGIERIEDLDGRKVVVGRGGTGEQLAKRLVPGAKLVYVDRYAPEGILLMRQGQADAALEDNSLIDYTAKQYPERLVALPQMFTSDAICFGVRKGEADFLRWLDMFISEYVRSGLYREYYMKWWGTEPAEIVPRW